MQTKNKTYATLSQQEENMLSQTMEFVKKWHSKDNTGHDFSHVMRVYQNACLLLKSTPANPFVVQMAALLHDVDDKKLNLGDRQVEKFLHEIQVPSAQIRQITDTIVPTAFRTTGDSPHLDTLEQAILFDADKLDAIGSIGICRTIMYGAAKNRPLFNADVFPKLDLTKEEYSNQYRTDETTIGHFFDKSLKLSAIMQTKAGKKEAAKRHKIMVKFLIEFFEEQDQDKWIAFLKNYLKQH